MMTASIDMLTYMKLRGSISLQLYKESGRKAGRLKLENFANYR